LLLPFADNPIGVPFIELQSVDSTNKYAMTLIHEANSTYLPIRQEGNQVKIGHGLVLFAHEQTSGKGQMGKKWLSEKGQNISMSLIISPTSLTVGEQFKLSVCTAVTVWEFFFRFASDETKIKWPNDLYWRDRKAGGILIENVVQSRQSAVGSWQWAVVGIGININQTSFPENLPNPVSLKQITGKNYEPLELAKLLCEIFDKNYKLLIAGKFQELFTLYQTHLYKKNEKVKLKKESRVFEATIIGVADSGQLITQTSIEERFSFGEIEWVL
jgi:BirA family transcriptional regulator, biotin operon repressor / biotin---[acetyl-CoA-carboxylase] ligase